MNKGNIIINTLKETFRIIMSLFDSIFEYDSPSKEGFSESFIENYENMGALDWHQFYLNEGEAANILMNEFGKDLGFIDVNEENITDDIIQLDDQIKNIENNISPKKEKILKEKALHRCPTAFGGISNHLFI